jgi:phosphatidate cytidylyltransferase
MLGPKRSLTRSASLLPPPPQSLTPLVRRAARLRTSPRSQFWFVFPVALVICNDTSAYFCGFATGKKIFKAQFLALSPNKTWEGFIGAFFCTCAFGFYFSKYLATFPFMACTFSQLSTLGAEQCRVEDVFRTADLNIMSWVSLLPPAFATYVPATPVMIRAAPIQLHGVALAAFASLVAPFGGKGRGGREREVFVCLCVC